MGNLKVYSAFNRRVGASQSFDEHQNDYGLVTNKVTGVTEVEVIGKTNIYKKIQEANVGLDIQQIVDTYTADGSTPQVDPKFFVDVSKAPKSMLEAHMQLRTLQEQFASRELEFRKKFDFDFGKYIASLDQNGKSTPIADKMIIDYSNSNKKKFYENRKAKIAADKKIAADLEAAGKENK